MEEIDWWREERIAWAEGYRCIVGLDEVGRGALAGPVVAACVLLPHEDAPSGINDSKALSPAQREICFEHIWRAARGIGVGIVEPETIDQVNILRATHQAMRLALDDLPSGLYPDLALIDGLPVQPFPIDQIALVQGDSRCISIAAASIIAKVTRDRLMREYDGLHPGYGFALHKGYGVPSHLRALDSLGPCPLHRRSFAPVERCSQPDASLPASTNPPTASGTDTSPNPSQSARRTRKTGRQRPAS
jgi:ribonuclease HII